MEGLVFKINGETINVTDSTLSLKEAADEAFSKSKYFTTHNIKSIHIGHLGTKAATSDTPIPSNNDSFIHLMLVPKCFIAVEDAEGCLETLYIHSTELSSELSRQVVSHSDVFSHIGKPISSLKVLAHIVPIRNCLASLDSRYHGFASKMVEYYESEKARMRIDVSIPFHQLGFYFVQDMKVIVSVRETTMGAIITKSNYQTSMFGGVTWVVHVAYTQFTTDKFVKFSTHYYINEYEGYKPFNELQLRKMTQGEEDTLAARGMRFIQYCRDGSTHLHYKGESFSKVGWYAMDKTYVNSRVIVDVIGFNENNANYDVFRRTHGSAETETFCVPYLCWPTLPAFCLATMQWGEVHIDGLSDIVFNLDAFDRLVIDENQKQLIRAVVENPFEYADLVEGKSMGTILLLHGPPGVGKTSSAEAVSEVLQKPLYKFTSGQLGVTPTELYKNLNTSLKLAQRWQAIALIDEVDIYLEKRSDNDIVRNAMVGIFLNLLEYYQGILFLTTNRVKCFDDAFKSRISISLHYKDFTPARRCQVWTKHLAAAGLGHIDGSDLGDYNLNGRQIGTCIRIAMSLAKSEGGKRVEKAHLLKTIQFNSEF
jgi:hypothetical protein